MACCPLPALDKEYSIFLYIAKDNSEAFTVNYTQSGIKKTLSPSINITNKYYEGISSSMTTITGKGFDAYSEINFLKNENDNQVVASIFGSEIRSSTDGDTLYFSIPILPSGTYKLVVRSK